MRRILLSVAIVVVWVASLAPAVLINLAHTRADAGNIGLTVLAVMSVICVPICLTSIPVLLSRHRYDLVIGAAMLSVFAMAFNLSNAAGLAGGDRDAGRQERAGQMNRVASSRERLAEANALMIEARARSKNATPDMVDAELLGLRADPVYSRSKQCADVTVGESKLHCGKIADALVRKAAAEEAERLDAETRELRARLDALGDAPSTEDARVDRVRAVVALVVPSMNETGRVGLSLDLLVALLVEALGSFLPPIVTVLVWSLRPAMAVVHVKPRPMAEPDSRWQSQTPAKQPVADENPGNSGEVQAPPEPATDGSTAEDPAILPATEVAASYDPADDVAGTIKTFSERCLVRRKAARMQARDVYGAYRKHCHDLGERPESQRAFGEGMTVLGWQKKTDRITTYLDIELRVTRPTLVAVDGVARQ